ncbi:MAG: carboxypeptidase-like regulatory domain-containing protein, partial [Gemmatimonadota bacterium]|nr:carboxypeptidase-like regulatory domain-containing protein [Gemmatimonadota bacterium]
MGTGRAPWAIVGLVLASALCRAPADAQSLRGVLSDRATYEPIDLGTVTLIDSALDTLAQVVTDERGYFSFDLRSSGEYYLIAAALGYQAMRSEAVRVGAGEARIVELSMAARPVPVEGLLVEARADEPQ